ncbi:MAG: hypothetical protein QGG96_00245 [Candidatus Poseidoniaceae archaeon]|nr:hypothetical protein [Candidatus Poseidoniaceae archaeon]
MPFCSHCGGEVAPNWAACPNCTNHLTPSPRLATPEPSFVKDVINFNQPQGFDDSIILLNQTKPSGITPKMIGIIVIGITLLTVALVLVATIGGGALEDSYSLEYDHATGYLYIDHIKVDNGEDDRLFEVEVFYDERNRYEYRTGEECDALEYYDTPRTYYLEELCALYYVDPFVEEVTFGACAEYVSSDRSYDISPNNQYATGCLKWQGSIANPSIEPSWGLEEECTYYGEIIEDEMVLAKFISWSGIDDGDSNSYNGEVDFTLAFVLSYECI